MNLDDFKVDIDKAEEGTWVEFGGDSAVLVAQWGNENHAKFLREIYKKNKRQIDMGILGDSAAASLMSGQWQHIIKGWRGIEKGGVTLEYSPKVVSDLAQNSQYRQFFKNIEELAKDHATFRNEAVEELGKN